MAEDCLIVVGLSVEVAQCVVCELRLMCASLEGCGKVGVAEELGRSW